jgi:hypothetical protein
MTVSLQILCFPQYLRLEIPPSRDILNKKNGGRPKFPSGWKPGQKPGKNYVTEHRFFFVDAIYPLTPSGGLHMLVL